MNILMVRSSAFNTPRLINQAKFLSEQGYNITIIYWERGMMTIENIMRSTDLKHSHGINSIPIKTKKAKYGAGVSNLVQRLSYFIKLIKHIKSSDYDVLHAVDFDSAFPCYFAIKNNKKVNFVYDIADFIQTFDNNIPSFVRKLMSFFDRKIFKRANAIILPDINRVKYISNEFKNKVAIVNNAPLFDKKLLNKNKIKIANNNRIKLVYYGALSEDRGIQFLLDCVGQFSNIDFHFAGWGQKVKDVIRKCEKYPNVFYHGKLNNYETLSFVSKMDIIYIFYDPNFEHNKVSSPNKMFEAFYLGKPMIVANNTSIDELVRKEDIGYTCNYDFESIVSILKDLKIEDLRKKGSNSSKLVEKFSYKIAQENLKSLYDSLNLSK